jgi:hypothetical protein
MIVVNPYLNNLVVVNSYTDSRLSLNGENTRLCYEVDFSYFEHNYDEIISLHKQLKELFPHKYNYLISKFKLFYKILNV